MQCANVSFSIVVKDVGKSIEANERHMVYLQLIVYQFVLIKTVEK